MEEPGRLRSMGLLRVRQDWATSLSHFTFMHWRRKWQPTPVFLPGESQGLGEPGGLLSMGSHSVGHNWSDLAAAVAYSTENLKKKKTKKTVENLGLQGPHLSVSAPQGPCMWKHSLGTLLPTSSQPLLVWLAVHLSLRQGSQPRHYGQERPDHSLSWAVMLIVG